MSKRDAWKTEKGEFTGPATEGHIKGDALHPVLVLAINISLPCTAPNMQTSRNHNNLLYLNLRKKITKKEGKKQKNKEEDS